MIINDILNEVRTFPLADGPVALPALPEGSIRKRTTHRPASELGTRSMRWFAPIVATGTTWAMGPI